MPRERVNSAEDQVCLVVKQVAAQKAGPRPLVSASRRSRSADTSCLLEPALATPPSAGAQVSCATTVQ